MNIGKTTSHEVLLTLAVLTDLTLFDFKKLFQTCKADQIYQTQQHAKSQNPVDNLVHFLIETRVKRPTPACAS